MAVISKGLAAELTFSALILAVLAGFLWSIGQKAADRVWPDKV